MSFYLFLTCSILVMAILMPVNYHVNGRLDTTPPEDDGDSDWPDWNRTQPASGRVRADPAPPGNKSPLEWFDLVSEMNSFLAIPFLFT